MMMTLELELEMFVAKVCRYAFDRGGRRGEEKEEEDSITRAGYCIDGLGSVEASCRIQM